MDFFKKMLEKKDSRAFVNLFTALAVGAGLILAGNYFEEDKKEETPLPLSAETEQKEDYAEKTAKELEEILKSVEGVGRIKVMLSLKDEGEQSLAEDVSTEKGSGGSSGEFEKQEQKTLLTGEDLPYITNRSSPRIEGVLISCDGGGSVEVKSSLISACSALFGIESNKIQVLKMGGE
ncbi:MAG: hypothetical protein LUC92_01120 [Clostridiales bacterium]|nr:hypothetical protein [Clostridiales bacterium]